MSLSAIPSSLPPVSPDAASSSTRLSGASSPAPPVSASAAGSSSSHSSNASTTNSAVSLAGTFSTSVGGKQYAASVDRSGSGYTALIADLPGVSGSGASLDTAETNLVAKLDAFV